MVLAHFGIAVALAGMAMNAAFTEERLAVARTGDRLSLGTLAGRICRRNPTAGKNWTAVEGELRATRGQGLVTL
jgi:cytochrome c-type biogenesis protein CcmF